MNIIEERWQKIQSISLAHGAHSPDSTFCVMEAVAFVAGEPWSDSPICACPIISAFLRNWNDSLRSNEERDRLLKGLIPQLVNTKNEKVELKRSFMAFDWLVRVQLFTWLRLAKLLNAQALENFPEIKTKAHVEKVSKLVDAAGAAAGAAAGDAAGAAAGDAAGDAARDALAPTVAILQQSALDLIQRMIAA